MDVLSTLPDRKTVATLERVGPGAVTLGVGVGTVAEFCGAQDACAQGDEQMAARGQAGADNANVNLEGAPVRSSCVVP